MSGHCPKCGDYCEEDDSRPCAKCATTPDERKAAEEWAAMMHHKSREFDRWENWDDHIADLASTKLSAERWAAAEPVVKRAVEAVSQVIRTVPTDFEERCPLTMSMLRDSLSALKGLTQ